MGGQPLDPLLFSGGSLISLVGVGSADRSLDSIDDSRAKKWGLMSSTDRTTNMARVKSTQGTFDLVTKAALHSHVIFDHRVARLRVSPPGLERSKHRPAIHKRPCVFFSAQPKRLPNRLVASLQ